MYYGHWDMGWGWAIAGGAMMVAFWLAVAWIVVTLARRSGGEGDRGPARPPASIAASRFAAGEIDEQEYERIIARLRADGPRRQ